jgi:SAM-dependent methyltransferase
LRVSKVRETVETAAVFAIALREEHESSVPSAIYSGKDSPDTRNGPIRRAVRSLMEIARLPEVSPAGNKHVYDRDADHYASMRALMPAERAALDGLRDRWGEIEMLDVGVGAGRTAYTFAAVAKGYVGLDYSERMVELSRDLIGERDGRSFEFGDVRDLSRWYGHEFDFVLFSFNGLDSVPAEDRTVALREIRKVIADDGLFLFSSHSLPALDLRFKRPSVRLVRPLWSSKRLVKAAVNHVRLRAANRELSLDEAKARGWALVREDPAHGFRLQNYWVMPRLQIAQLESAGFALVELTGMAGESVDPDAPGDAAWLHYLCRPI